MAVILSERAAAHVRRHFSGEDEPAVRLRARPAGCSGYMYSVEEPGAIRDNDSVFTWHGVRVVVDPVSLPLVDGTEIDFVREGLNEGFRFHNPRAAATCGCGESFAVADPADAEAREAG